jgi:hypothetical protein
MPQEGRSLVGENEQRTTWGAEGRAMLQAGLELQRIALSLPVGSGARGELLQDAKQRFAAARVRGITA